VAETDKNEAISSGSELISLMKACVPLGSLKENYPNGARFGPPKETAAVVCLLASEEASFITGQCISVIGGRGYE
jgi:NAD(P)-dependent dehydrogenase (short-subunit alcohol dehydrogenase family)